MGWGGYTKLCCRTFIFSMLKALGPTIRQVWQDTFSYEILIQFLSISYERELQGNLHSFYLTHQKIGFNTVNVSTCCYQHLPRYSLGSHLKTGLYFCLVFIYHCILVRQVKRMKICTLYNKEVLLSLLREPQCSSVCGGSPDVTQYGE